MCKKGERTIAENHEFQLEMYTMLKSAVEKGVHLYLEGEITSPEKITQEYCLNEDAVYMPDYVMNREGKWTELRYDRISAF